MPKGAFGFDAQKRSWVSVGTVDPAPIQSVIFRARNLKALAQETQRVLTLAESIMKMRIAVRQEDWNSAKAEAQDMLRGTSHPHAFWEIVHCEIVDVQHEGSRRVAAHELLRYGPRLLTQIRTIAVRLDSNIRSPAHQIRLIPLESESAQIVRNLVESSWDYKPRSPQLEQLRRLPMLILAMRFAILHNDWNALDQMVHIAVDLRAHQLEADLSRTNESCWYQILGHEVVLAERVKILVDIKFKLARALETGLEDGTKVPLIKSTKYLPLEPLQEALELAKTWESLEPTQTQSGSPSSPKATARTLASNEQYLNDWIRHPPPTRNAEQVLNEITSRTRVLMVRCEHVLEIRKVTKQKGWDRQTVSIMIQNALVAIAEADSEVLASPDGHSSALIHDNLSIGVEELKDIQQRIDRMQRRRSTLTNLSSAVDARDEMNVKTLMCELNSSKRSISSVAVDTRERRASQYLKDCAGAKAKLGALIKEGDREQIQAALAEVESFGAVGQELEVARQVLALETSPRTEVTKKQSPRPLTPSLLQAEVGGDDDDILDMSDINERAAAALRSFDIASIQGIVDEATAFNYRSPIILQLKKVLLMKADAIAVLKATAAAENGDRSGLVDLTMLLKERQVRNHRSSIGVISNLPMIQDSSVSMTYSQHPIRASLTKLPQKRLMVQAKSMFKSIMGFMGELDFPHPAAKGFEVLQLIMREPGLRDEAMCQILKQLTSNPNDDSRSRGLILLGLLLAHFHPSSSLEDHVEALLVEQQASGVRRVLHHKIIQHGRAHQLRVSLKEVVACWDSASEDTLMGILHI